MNRKLVLIFSLLIVTVMTFQVMVSQSVKQQNLKKIDEQAVEASITIVEVNPTSVHTRVGSSFEAKLQIENVSNLYGLDVNLTWNPDLLSLDTVNASIGVETYPEGVLHEQVLTINFTSASNYELVAFSLNPAPSFNGSGTIAELGFSALEVGVSDLLLDSMLANFNQSGPSQEIPHLKINSTVDIQPRYTPVHNIKTGLNYTSIQAAIDASATLNGHTILVDAGTYYEHVVVSKSLVLLGRDRSNTAIDGNGTGTVVKLFANDITVANFTIRNAGQGLSWLDSCVFGNYSSNVLIENNTIMDASNGVIFYGFSNSTMRNNLVEECGLMGLHLDGNCAGCEITDNTVTHCLEGIEIDASAGNTVEGNQILYNNASLVLVSCNGLNTLKSNNMTSESYNIIVWGASLEAFIQGIDTSNTVNGKKVYYITNAHSLTINPSSYLKLGFLAVVNCTDITIKDADLSSNKDGLLLAQSTNCNISNITLSENQGPLLYGGLTFFKSNNNSVFNARIINNSVGLCLYQSNGNLFHHNSFIDNDVQVISNFNSPFSSPSGTYSTNKWDSDYEGNYWSDYTGVDSNNDGIGEDVQVIDANNTDDYPLMGMFSDFAATSELHVQTISNSTVSDFQFNGTAISFDISGEAGTMGFSRIVVPSALMGNTFHVFVNGTEVSYTLLPRSNSTHDYLYFTYHHSTQPVVLIPEFPSFLIVPVFMSIMLMAIAVKRRKTKSTTTLL
jgi:parallel beta-helix repeat protein